MATEDQADNDVILAVLTKTNVTDAIRERITRLIREGRFKAGDKLPSEGKLVESLQVSRVALREALRSLEAVGIIESRPGSGWYVQDYSQEAAAKALFHGLEMDERVLVAMEEIQSCLEEGFLVQAIESLAPEDLTFLQDMVARMQEQAEAGLAHYDADYLFHKRLFAKIDNEIFHRFIDVLWILYRAAPAYLPTAKISNRDYLRKDATRHGLILDAIVAGDVSLAKQRLRDHFTKGAVR